MAKIFVSHSSADAALAESLKERLTGWGYQSFFVAPDPVHGPMAGTLWQKELYHGLAGARLVLVLWGEHFRESAWCLAEIILADFKDIPIVPVITDATPLDTLLESRQAVDLRQGSMINYDILRQAITRRLDPAEDFAWDPRRSPFPGLEPFGSGDAAVYFGREEELAAARACLSQLLPDDSRRILAIQGGSGAGKSSFLNAGLLPRLRRDLRRQWRVPPPINRYNAPLLRLARALTTISSLSLEVLLDCLVTGSPDQAAAKLVQLLDTTLGPDDHNGERPILLALDQAEALIPTMATEEAQRFQNILQSVLNAPGSPLILAVVVRTEAISELSAHFDLSSRSAEIVRIAPMPDAELPKVIEQPCSVAGIQMASGLTKRMVDDLRHSPALPLLAYTLSEMYERAADSDRRFTLELYERVGGIRGSIESQIKFLEGDDVGELERIALQSAFGHLVTVTDDGQPIRQSARWDVIPVGAHRLIKELIRRHLMRTFSLSEESRVELTHESLFQLWPQLAQWVQQNELFLRWRRRFNAALDVWLGNKRAPEDLLRGRALTEAVDWQGQRPEDLSKVQQEFIAASERRHDDEEERVRNLYRRAEGLRLAAQAELLAMEKISGDPSVALILATESMKWQKSFEADRALRAALGVAAPIYWQLPKGRSPVTVTGSLPSGKLIAVGYADGCCRVFDPEGGNEIITVRHEPASRPRAPRRSGGRPPGGSLTEDVITVYPVHGVAFTSDGKHLVSASEDGTCRMWDISSGGEVYRYTRDSALVSLAVSADSDLAVCGAKDGTVALLDLLERHVVWEGGVADTAVLQVALAPDSRYVVFIGSDGLVMAISAEGVQQWRYEADFGCLALTISPDNALVAVTGDGTKGVLLDAASGSLMAQIDSVAEKMKAAAWDAEGRSLAVITNYRHCCIFAPNGRRLREFAHNYWFVRGTAVATSAAGNRLAVGFDIGTVTVLTGEGDVELCRSWMSGAITSVTFVGRGDRLLIGAADGSLRMIGTDGGSEVRRVQHDGRVNAVAHRDMRGKNLVASCDSAGNVEVYFLSDGVHVSLPHAQGVEALGFDEDGAVMATGSEDGLCRVFSLSPDGKVHLLCQLAHDAKDSGLSVIELSPNEVLFGPIRMSFGDENLRSTFDHVVESGRRRERIVKDVSVTRKGGLVATASGDGTCRVLDVARCVEIAKFPYKYEMDAVAISPIGDRVAYVTQGGDVHVHSLQAVTGQEKHWEAKNVMANKLVFSPDGKTLACAGNGELHVYDVVDGRAIPVVIDERYNDASCVAFSADGRYAASAGTSGKARVYETEGWTEVARLQQESAVWAVCLNADGSLLATGTDLRTAHVFDVHAKEEIVRVRHDASLTAVAIDRDGKILVTGSEDRTARVWWIAADQLMEQAASRITRPLRDEEQRRFFGTHSDRDR